MTKYLGRNCKVSFTDESGKERDSAVEYSELNFDTLQYKDYDKWLGLLKPITITFRVIRLVWPWLHWPYFFSRN